MNDKSQPYTDNPRQPGFRGGIQPGTSASSIFSKDTENIPYQWIQSNLSRIEHTYNIRWKKSMTSQEIKSRINTGFADDINGMNPDGGMFLDDNDNILLVIECKHQGARGNAIERWGLNAITAKSMGALRYMTIFTGEGFSSPDKYPSRVLSRYCISDLCHNSTCWHDDGPDAFAGNYFYNNLEILRNTVGKDIIHEIELAKSRSQEMVS